MGLVLLRSQDILWSVKCKVTKYPQMEADELAAIKLTLHTGKKIGQPYRTLTLSLLTRSGSVAILADGEIKT